MPTDFMLSSRVFHEMRHIFGDGRVVFAVPNNFEEALWAPEGYKVYVGMEQRPHEIKSSNKRKSKQPIPGEPRVRFKLIVYNEDNGRNAYFFNRRDAERWIMSDMMGLHDNKEDK